MLQALLAGVASIQAQQTRMNVIGNNLANINTTAYKSSSVTFQDMIAQTIRGASGPSASDGGTNPIQYGLGVLVGSTNTNDGQGSLSATGVPSDLAIQGNGFFLVSNGTNVSYTRDGGCDLDANGDLVQGSTGERLLGWTADSLGNINTSTPITSASTLNIPLGTLNATQVTSQISYTGNLNSSALATDSWTTTEVVYDSLGGATDVTVQYTNHVSPPAAAPVPPATAASQWDWTAYQGTDTTGPVVGSSVSAGNTPLYFDNNGNQVSNLAAGTFNTVTVPASTTAPAFTINMNYSGIKQLATASQVEASNQNGYPPGSLDGYSISTNGTITGNFTNGLTRPLGQVAVGIFSNPGGLQRTGSNLWEATNNSGVAVVGAPNTGGRGNINSGYLEQSNVDISTEFTNLIVTQRGFEANTKVVTTVDQMLASLIQMKQG